MIFESFLTLMQEPAIGAPDACPHQQSAERAGWRIGCENNIFGLAEAERVNFHC